MTENKTKIIAEPGKPELTIEREFDAPRELVFRAYTEPDLIVKWWGPKDITTTIEKMELKPGGEWRFISTNPDGSKDVFFGEYKEIDPPRRMSQTFNYEPIGPGHESVDSAVFEELPDDRTRVISKSAFKSVADRDGMMQSGMEQGVNEGYERLDDLLEELRG